MACILSSEITQRMMPNQPKPSNQSMLTSPKLETNQRAQTMAMPTKPQRAKGTPNSPNAGLNKTKDTPRWHLNGINMQAYKRVQTWSTRQQPFNTLKGHQMQAYKHTTRTEMAWQVVPNH